MWRASISAPKNTNIRAASAAVPKPAHASKKRKFAGITQTQTSTPQGELKILDVAAATYGVNTTTSVQGCNLMLRGTDSGTRIGRKIKLRSVEIRGFLFADPVVSAASVTSIAQQCRLLIVYDRQANGVAPTVAQVITGIQGPYTEANLGRFLVIQDKTWCFGPAAAVSPNPTFGIPPTQANVFERHQLNLPTHYNAGNAGTVADIDKGSLYMLWIGSVAGGDTDASFAGTIRTQYTDE